LPPQTRPFDRLRDRYGWTALVIVMFAAMVVWRATQLPQFAGFEVRTITAGALTFALLAMAQGVVVMSGGINMGVGALMILVNCLAAKLMNNQNLAVCLLVGVGCVMVAMALSALMGFIVSISGVPDIVVTLALSFTFTGTAWLILRGPGGGTSSAFQRLLVGDFSNPVPSILVMAIALAAIWLPFSRSRTGLSMFAMGSSRQAAFLAGVDVARARVKVYTMSGVFVGLAGVVTTAFTGSGDPQSRIGLSALMTSVAAAVLGGVALTGGVGGLLGPVIAAMMLGLIPGILLGLGVDPNWGQVVNGIVIIVVVLAGGAIQMRRRAT
jgi:ribose transport system permease protein